MTVGVLPAVVYPASVMGSSWPVPTWNLRHRIANRCERQTNIAGTFLSINSPEELSAWANRHFPVAHFNPWPRPTTTLVHVNRAGLVACRCRPLNFTFGRIVTFVANHATRYYTP
jgi:hypothetical protein